MDQSVTVRVVRPRPKRKDGGLTLIGIRLTRVSSDVKFPTGEGPAVRQTRMFMLKPYGSALARILE